MPSIGITTPQLRKVLELHESIHPESEITLYQNGFDLQQRGRIQVRFEEKVDGTKYRETNYLIGPAGRARQHRDKFFAFA